MSHKTLRSDFIKYGATSNKKYGRRNGWKTRTKFKDNSHKNATIKRENNGILKVTIENDKIGKLNKQRKKPRYQYQRYLKSIQQVDKNEPVIIRSTTSEETTDDDLVLSRDSGKSAKRSKAELERTVTREIHAPAKKSSFPEERMEIDIDAIEITSGEDDNSQDNIRSIFTENIRTDAKPLDKKFTTIMRSNQNTATSSNRNPNSQCSSNNGPQRKVYGGYTGTGRSRRRSFSPNPRVFLHSLPL